MKFFQTFFSFGILALSATGIYAEDVEEYVRGADPQADAIYDMQLGMNGLQAAAKNPMLLAQLLQDLQDPSMMAEAKKMMEGKEFKKEMGEFEKSKEFKEAASKTKEMMDDPAAAARMQAQMEHMVKRGQDGMKESAKDSMTEAIEAMSRPEVLGEALKMMKDPGFMEQMKAMAQDPSFQHYMAAMTDMVKDPVMKAQMDEINEGFKAEL